MAQTTQADKANAISIKSDPTGTCCDGKEASGRICRDADGAIGKASGNEPELVRSDAIGSNARVRIYRQAYGGSLAPEVATAYQEWATRHMEMAAEDAKRFFADGQKFAETGARLLSNGWQANGHAGGGST